MDAKVTIDGFNKIDILSKYASVNPWLLAVNKWDLVDHSVASGTGVDCAPATTCKISSEASKPQYILTEEDANKLLEKCYERKAKEMKIKRVIFDGPATVVFWTDGSKTVVKCTDNDSYSYEVGVAMATLKKIFGESYSKYRHDVDKAIDAELERQEKKKEITKKDAAGLVQIANAIMDSFLKGDKDGK